MVVQHIFSIALRALCAQAMSRVMRPIDAQIASDYELEAYFYCVDLGYANPEEEMPAMIANEPNLREGWEDGADGRWTPSH